MIDGSMANLYYIYSCCLWFNRTIITIRYWNVNLIGSLYYLNNYLSYDNIYLSKYSFFKIIEYLISVLRVIKLFIKISTLSKN
jgi:hypothetical protein